MYNQQFSPTFSNIHYSSSPKKNDVSDITDEDCEDVDEMMIVSDSKNQKKEQIDNLQLLAAAVRAITRGKIAKPKNMVIYPDQQFNENIDSNFASNSKTTPYNQENQEFTSETKVDPENEQDFRKAYQRLVEKLGKEEGAHLLIPQDDLKKMQQSQKLRVEDIQQKVIQFEDKKRQKIHLLKEEKESKEIEECIFTPQIMTRKRNEAPQPRNLDQFLQDQKRFEELKKQKQQERLEENAKSQMSQTIKSTYVNEKSKRMLEQRQIRQTSQQREEPQQFMDSARQQINHRNKENGSITRFGSTGFGNKLNSSASKANEYSFQPSITKKSQNMQRDRPVQDVLYEEAFRRKAKLQQKEKEIYKQHEKQVNKESQKLVIQKFQREFQQALNDLFQTEFVLKEINYLNMKQLLVIMGFCTESAANSDSNERVLLYDIWRILEGDQRDYVLIDDLRTLMMSIAKITEYKRINVVPDEEESQNIDQNAVGFFNKKGQFCLRSEDISIIYRQFDLLNVNRIQHLGRLQQEKRNNQRHDHSFKPQISKKTETFEWLSAQGNKDEWRQNAKQVLEQEELKECTFKPNLVQGESSNQRSILSANKRQGHSQITSQTRLRDGQSTDRFNELYNLAKNQKRMHKQDKTTEEIEYEKQKEECSFVPNVHKINNQSECLPPTQHERPIVDDKYIQKDIERKRKAREERERVKKFTERGIILNESQSRQNNASQYNQKRPSTMTNANSYSRTSNDFNQPMSQRGSINSTRGVQQQQQQIQNRPQVSNSKSKNLNAFNPSSNQQIVENSSIATPAKQYRYSDQETLRQAKQNHQQLQQQQQQQLVNQKIQNQQKTQEIKKEEQPLLFIDINLGEESSERIVVFEGDSAQELAMRFCEIHNLDEETQMKLEEQLAAQIRSVLSKIDEESELRTQE
ncbi:UNKNOWN [Stylonychia lemnae]|uniref:Uncharacterized protein n=1 Tax=Stylonychia lemnae TaxID=5949 RepID=A0A077ZT02_STYLE|nr:UNKNOWN [Stylonychia lemnae]|eukprot:CDW71596.1 UNKNOWN [Stylonychia lemnae]